MNDESAEERPSQRAARLVKDVDQLIEDCNLVREQLREDAKIVKDLTDKILAIAARVAEMKADDAALMTHYQKLREMPE